MYNTQVFVLYFVNTYNNAQKVSDFSKVTLISLERQLQMILKSKPVFALE